jgi:UDP-N-acetylglucosamine 2-epimerase (non-hydrolysing)
VRISEEADRILNGQGKQGRVPALWDGRSSERIAELYERVLGASSAALRASA